MARYKVKPLTEAQYKEAPESVRRFIISVTKNIPISEDEKAKTIKEHPQYFQRMKPQKPKTHSQKLRRFYALKGQQEKEPDRKNKNESHV